MRLKWRLFLQNICSRFKFLCLFLTTLHLICILSDNCNNINFYLSKRFGKNSEHCDKIYRKKYFFL